MSAPDRRAMVERPGKDLSVRRQCALVGVARSGVYRPKPVAGADDLAVMRRIDELHLELPFYGSRRMTFELNLLVEQSLWFGTWRSTFQKWRDQRLFSIVIGKIEDGASEAEIVETVKGQFKSEQAARAAVARHVETARPIVEYRRTRRTEAAA